MRGLTKAMSGIEIAPYFAPLAPKREGYNSFILDIFDKDALVRRGQDDPNVPAESLANIEGVDFVGSATEIAELVPLRDHGSFDYIISSHNFEHLPNPIRFLQGCAKVLKPGGILSMAIPDARACFDCFRPHTSLGEWLTAYRNGATKPSAAQIFEFQSSFALLRIGDTEQHAFSLEADPDQIVMVGDLSEAYQAWLRSGDADPYSDVHCSVMTPCSFQLLLAECNHLGLVSLRCVETAGPEDCEFYVRLVNAPPTEAQEDINPLRTELSRLIWRERARPAEELSHSSSGGSPQIRGPRARTASLRKRLSQKYFHPFKRRYSGLLKRP
jgi:SAM-dependent methyltransferase